MKMENENPVSLVKRPSHALRTSYGSKFKKSWLWGCFIASVAVLLAGVAARLTWANAPLAADWLHRWHITAPDSLVRRAKEQKFKALTRAAESGDAVAQYEVYQGTPDQELWRVRHWLESSAQAGYPAAQYERGLLADAEEDYGNAVYWYRKAAAQGYGRAELELGYEYQMGRGVPVDNWAAYEWMRKAAEQGEAFAAENIGMCSYSGDCPPLRRDYRAACRWLLIAHALGNGPTCNAEIQSRITSAELLTAQDAAAEFLRLNRLPKRAGGQAVN